MALSQSVSFWGTCTYTLTATGGREKWSGRGNVEDREQNWIFNEGRAEAKKKKVKRDKEENE